MRSDRLEVRQILTTFASDAAKHTDEGLVEFVVAESDQGIGNAKRFAERIDATIGVASKLGRGIDVNTTALSGDRLVPLLTGARDRLGARIVFFRSNDESTLRTQVRESGADGFIRKGDIDRLGDRVAAIMRPS